MTPDKALKKCLQGRRVRHVETGCVWECNTGRRVEMFPLLCNGAGADHFPAYGTFRLLKEKWKPGEVRWQRNGDSGVVWRYTAERDCFRFDHYGAFFASCAWSVRDGIIDITPEEGLRLIHAMGWNEDGTKYVPTPTLDELRKLVGEDPRVGDVVKSDIFTRTVKAVTPEFVVYTFNDALGVRSRAEWAEICKSAIEIERAK
jgi:hypothetical protein